MHVGTPVPFTAMLHALPPQPASCCLPLQCKKQHSIRTSTIDIHTINLHMMGAASSCPPSCNWELLLPRPLQPPTDTPYGTAPERASQLFTHSPGHALPLHPRHLLADSIY